MTTTAPTAAKGRRRRRLLAAGATILFMAGALASYAPFGGCATGARRARIHQSPEWQGSHFENPQPVVNDTWGALASMTKNNPNAEPTSPPSTVAIEPDRFATPPPRVCG